MTSITAGMTMQQCGYCGNFHRYSFQMCKDMHNRPMVHCPAPLCSLCENCAKKDKEIANKDEQITWLRDEVAVKCENCNRLSAFEENTRLLAEIAECHRDLASQQYNDLHLLTERDEKIRKAENRIKELEAYDCDNNTLVEIIRLKERIKELEEVLEKIADKRYDRTHHSQIIEIVREALKEKI